MDSLAEYISPHPDQAYRNQTTRELKKKQHCQDNKEKEDINSSLRTCSAIDCKHN